MNYYTGVGSRETPFEFFRALRVFAAGFALAGWTLRTGGAPGADSAFEEGALRAARVATYPLPPVELYLPWPGFEGRTENVRLDKPTPGAYKIAAKIHPAWGGLSDGARSLHARNVHQVLGPDVDDPILSRLVVCWTPGGKGGGGTGQAIRVANLYGVQVVDLGG